MQKVNMRKVAPNLWLIPLDQDLPGFRSFIGSWLYKGEKTFLVDVGPAATIPRLFNALDQSEVESLDAILLTHIHIDHAGGIGDFISRFPDTPVVCHGSGIRHVADPSRLWEGSLRTLGDTARAYGSILPVPVEQLHDAAGFSEHGIRPFLTPGHAPHHVSYLFGDYLFAGEASGVYAELPDGGFYLRPATPPRFFLETSVQSIDTLLTVPHTLICFGHFGVSQKTPEILESHKNQLFRWAEVIQAQMARQDEPDFLDQCMAVLLEKDPLLAGWHHLEPDVQKREKGFFYNSIRGFVGYFNA